MSTPHSARSRRLKITLLAVLTCLAAALAWYLFTHDVPPGRTALLSFGILALMWTLGRTGVLPPHSDGTPVMGPLPRATDVLLFIGCYAGAIAWVAFVSPRVSHTNAGAATVLVPGLLLLLGGTVFLVKALFRRPQRPRGGRDDSV